VLGIIIYKTLARYGRPGYASAMAIIFIILLVAFTLICMQDLWRPERIKAKRGTK
jgi:multiple sugar transport system permease protein